MSLSQGIFTGSGGPLSLLYDVSGPFSSFGNPALNNGGVVAFVANLDAGGSGLFIGDGGTPATVADTSGPFSGFGGVSLNDAGTVAFFATLDAGGSGLFTGDGVSVTAIADTGGPFSGFGDPSLNNAGVVAFFATLDGGGSGIFVGPDPVADRVIGTGDALFGSTVTGLAFSREGLNDAGQVAFVAALADGRQVVVRADPPGVAAIPEPSSLALLGLGTLGLLAYGRRRRRSCVRGSSVTSSITGRCPTGTAPKN